VTSVGNCRGWWRKAIKSVYKVSHSMLFYFYFCCVVCLAMDMYNFITSLQIFLQREQQRRDRERERERMDATFFKLYAHFAIDNILNFKWKLTYKMRTKKDIYSTNRTLVGICAMKIMHHALTFKQFFFPSTMMEIYCFMLV
jgi:hypothetical protein